VSKDDPTSRVPLTSGRFPFVPDHAWGALLEKDAAMMVLWLNDHAVEPASSSSASVAAVEELTATLEAIDRGPDLSVADILRDLEAKGYRQVGDRQFRFMSGSLYQYADLLARAGMKAAAKRSEMLRKYRGRAPVGTPDWAAWIASTMTAAACAYGARITAIASVEAFVNEVLSLNAPDALERCRVERKGMEGRLKELCSLLGLDPDAPWCGQLVGDIRARNRMVHHAAGYVDTDMDDHDSVSLTGDRNPKAAIRTLHAVDELFRLAFKLAESQCFRRTSR
jgi:hypothetical protein